MRATVTRKQGRGMQSWLGMAMVSSLAVALWGCGASHEEGGEIHEAHEAGEHEGEGDEHEGEDEEHEDEGEEHEGEGEEHEGEEHEGEEHEGGEHEGGEHGHAAGPVSDFHAVLSPLWHAQPGATRTDQTCAAVADFRTKAQAIQTGPVPEGARADEAGYRQAAAGLVTAVEALGTACAERNRPSFDARFQALHTAFHGVAERAEGE